MQSNYNTEISNIQGYGTDISRLFSAKTTVISKLFTLKTTVISKLFTRYYLWSENNDNPSIVKFIKRTNLYNACAYGLLQLLLLQVLALELQLAALDERLLPG